MMNNRALLFWIGCIGTRLFIVFLAYKYYANAVFMKVLASLALIPAIGFFVIYFFGLRKRGLEVGGELIWWNHLRPVHGILWLSFAISAFLGYKYAWVFLLVDTIVGMLAWINKYYSLNFFRKPLGV